MSAELHHGVGIDGRANQVLDVGPPQVMHDPIGEPDGSARLLPRLPKVPDGLADAMENVGAIEAPGREPWLDYRGKLAD